jgi:hypothetical protein
LVQCQQLLVQERNPAAVAVEHLLVHQALVALAA